MRIIDLFSGAGGLTFGFYYKLENDEFVKTNNKFIFANEKDIEASIAFKKNFEDIEMLTGDIREVLSNEVIAEKIGKQSIDLIIGGPPCQSFSTIGQRRYDDKAKLFWEYLRILKLVKPKMFLFENVKGILSMKEVFYKLSESGEVLTEKKHIGHEGGKQRIVDTPIVDHYGDKVLDIIKREFGQIENDLGYEIEEQTINAVDYGVPQNRERVIIVGIRKDLKLKFPKLESKNKIKITIEDAISDLPAVNEGEHKVDYECEAKNSYQKLMRGRNRELKDHFCGIYGDKIRTVIKNIKQGQGRNDFNKLVEIGLIDKKYYLTSGYANTYGRLVKNQPSTTITNNLCTPSGLRCIHYEQNRALTPREGARIQSFPDWFEFFGSRTALTKQIGNAVPPLLAMAVAKHITSILGENENEYE